MIFDATGLAMGRLASITAKCLLQGEEIKIVNAEKAIISGKKEAVLREYREMLREARERKAPTSRSAQIASSKGRYEACFPTRAREEGMQWRA